MAPVIQSFKKVLNGAPASRAASTDITRFLSTGTDSVAAGQTSVGDALVPTGSIIKFIEIQWSASNLAAVACFVHVCIQQTHAGQSPVSPLTVGGSPQRNQVFFQAMYLIGKDQNSNHVFRFKVPKKFQRVREGDNWQFVTNGDTVYADATQVIYKFYR